MLYADRYREYLVLEAYVRMYCDLIGQDFEKLPETAHEFVRNELLVDPEVFPTRMKAVMAATLTQAEISKLGTYYGLDGYGWLPELCRDEAQHAEMKLLLMKLLKGPLAERLTRNIYQEIDDGVKGAGKLRLGDQIFVLELPTHCETALRRAEIRTVGQLKERVEREGARWWVAGIGEQGRKAILDALVKHDLIEAEVAEKLAK